MVVLATNNYCSFKSTLSVKKGTVSSVCTHLAFCYTTLCTNHCQGSEVLVHNLFTPPAISIINCIVGHHSVNFHQCFPLLQRTNKCKESPFIQCSQTPFLGRDFADGANMEINEICLCVSYSLSASVLLC